MKLITPVNIPANKGWIDHRQSVLLMGSCFADEIGRKMRDDWFDCVVNPFGVLYNPKSIQFSLERMLEGNPFHRDDLFESQGLWHSPYHHG
ncbi:MAG: GSCFA domain-containing protein, partial [Bacteroidaceae bacterium]|nr:GSCFA domain-containing protein [Bacteroidaceae bacterium]